LRLAGLPPVSGRAARRPASRQRARKGLNHPFTRGASAAVGWGPRSEGRHHIDRRQFITTTGGAFAGARLLGTRARAAAGTPPNILVIVVDELRYPRVFPQGISDAGGFLSQFMPNTYSLVWQKGVKFAGHYTAACACTPARGTLVTGLYAQQSWLLITILDTPTTKVSPQPVLRPIYPTYGRLLQQAGFQTPYIGKWHLSIPSQNGRGLDAYGFDYRLYPDPTGSNLQGTIGDADPLYGNIGDGTNTGYLNDANIATQAAGWLQQRKPSDQPWCLTVDFINPHDKEFFPAGTEFLTYTNLFDSSANPKKFQQFIDFTDPKSGSPKYDWNTNPLKAPPSLAYPAVPPNWESADQIAKQKPSTQTFARLFQEAVWGGVNDDPSATDFSIVEYHTHPPLPMPYGVGRAPYSYWQRSLDSYTQIMGILDVQIANVINALPSAVANNTIIVLTSDHGEYAGAHGFVSGKAGSCYEEVYNVPLIVYDPTGRFTGDIDTIRTGLTSSVDILPLLVSLGYNGSRAWLTGDLFQIYGRRHDLLPMLKSASAAGRPYVVFTTDETVPQLYNFNKSPGHITGVRTADSKLGVYADWQRGTVNIAFNNTLEREYYDYTTPGGRAETANTNNEAAAHQLYQKLVTDILPNELRAPLPSLYAPAQTLAKIRYLTYVQLINSLTNAQLIASVGDILSVSVGDI
jgi:arylsulfatase A-like enzyme